MKIVGVTRIRNEEDIIFNTLEHVSNLVDEIYIFDDYSTDSTTQICLKFPKVKRIIQAKTWETNPHKRQILEGTQRQAIYKVAKESQPDWIYYFDADEYTDFDNIDLFDTSYDAYSMRLFDFYITPQDVEEQYLNRKFMGPEFRDILTLFRPKPDLHFYTRVPFASFSKVGHKGFIKHYGKAISIEQWEQTCDYYINFLYERQPGNSTISEKWKKRKGKAIHTQSDFGRSLIEWKDRFDTAKIINNSKGQAE
jgi:glycosyltransferase involved in cell wall biosynthesis